MISTDQYQLLVTLLTACIPVLMPWWLDRLRLPRGEERWVRPRVGRPPQLEDLGIGLLVTAFLGCILVHSLFVSGRVPGDIDLLLCGSVLALTLSGGLVAAWRRDWLERFLTALGFATLGAFTTAPGMLGGLTEIGPEPSLPVVAPCTIMVFLLAALIGYSHGSPLDSGRHRLHRAFAGASLGLMTAGVTLVTGLNLQRSVMNEEGFPQYSSPQAAERSHRTLQQLFRSRPAHERGVAYQLLSEQALEPFYTHQYLEVSHRLETLPTFEEGQRQIAELYQKIRSINESLPLEPYARTRQDQLLGELRKKISDLENRVAYRQCLEEITAQAASGSTDQLAAELRQRLDFVHPIPRKGETQVDLVIPARSAQGRFGSIARSRALQAWGKRRGEALARQSGGSRFDAALQGVFKLDGVDVQSIESRAVSEGYTGQRMAQAFGYTTHLFPWEELLETRGNVPDALVLPATEEAYLAYLGYRKLSIRRQDLNPREVALLGTFTEGLSSAGQRAVVGVLFSAPSAELNSSIRLIPVLERKLKRVGLKVDGSPDSDRLDLALQYLAGHRSRPPSSLRDPAVRALTELKGSLAENDRLALEGFFLRTSGGANVTDLFSSEVTQFLERLVNELAADEMDRVVLTLGKPVSSQLLGLVKDRPDAAELAQFSADLDGLSPRDREAFLLGMASGMYRPDPNLSPGLASRLIYQATFMDGRLGVFVASLMVLPVFLISLLMGLGASRFLADRDRLRSLAEAEESNGSVSHHQLAAEVDLLGRDELLTRLQKLGSKGWSTIALAGRRGIGKSRILYELYRRANHSQRPEIGVWMTSPSRFEEREFILSMLESMSRQVESSVASSLGARPYNVRKLRWQLLTGYIFAGLLSSWTFLLVMGLVYSVLDRAEVIIGWLPTLLMSFAGLMMVGVQVVRAQPTDLSLWLESDRRTNPHAVLLYRHTQKVLSFVRRANGQSRAGQDQRLGRLVQLLVSLGLSALAVWFGGLFLFSQGGDKVAYLGGSSLSLLLLVLSFLRSERPTDDITGVGLMTIISVYREFAQEVARRLQLGALGQRQGEARVVVCVDELDKIIEESEIRGFLRRIKGIFELPGVYYYLSIARDAMAHMRLGATLGKNEVDSSIDHVVDVFPLALEELSQMARSCLLERGLEPERTASLQRVLGAMSLGVPRDLLRLCDEAVADPERNPQELVEGLIERDLRAALEFGLLSQDAAAQLRALEPAGLAQWLRQPDLSEGAVRLGLVILARRALLADSDREGLLKLGFDASDGRTEELLSRLEF